MSKSKPQARKPALARTRGELAQALDVSLQSIAVYLAEGAPGRTAGGYDIEAMRAWRAANKGEIRGQNGAETSDGARLKKAQADKEEARAALTTLELEIQRGEYIPLAEVKDRDLARIAVVKRGLFSLADSLAGRLAGLEQREIKVQIRTAVRGLLEKFAGM